MENTFGSLIIIFIVLAIVIGVYVAQAILLNKLNKLINGKGTALAWIPICNYYLLGKLTINKLVGWILVGCLLLTSKFGTTINGVRTEYTLLPGGINSLVTKLLDLAVFGLYVYAIVKYNQLKKSGINNQTVQSQQPMQQQIQQQNVQTQQPMQPQFQQQDMQPQQATPIVQPQDVQPDQTQLNQNNNM